MIAIARHPSRVGRYDEGTEAVGIPSFGLADALMLR